MFGFFYNKEKLINDTKNEIYQKIKEKAKLKIEENKKIKWFSIEQQVGKLVICVSNEVQNPIVGYGKEIIFIGNDDTPFLVVQDIVNNCEIIPFGKVFTYTEQKFHALNSLEANERIAIIYNQYEEFEINKSYSPTIEKIELFDNEVWNNKVQQAIKKYKAFL